uniref:RRM domain-containing protein n=1 Tax=Stomoxys calcitrans TaxID=35570 RepID=A0A1I8NUD8_STOCA
MNKNKKKTVLKVENSEEAATQNAETLTAVNVKPKKEAKKSDEKKKKAKKEKSIVPTEPNSKTNVAAKEQLSEADLKKIEKKKAKKLAQKLKKAQRKAERLGNPEKGQQVKVTTAPKKDKPAKKRKLDDGEQLQSAANKTEEEQVPAKKQKKNKKNKRQPQDEEQNNKTEDSNTKSSAKPSDVKKPIEEHVLLKKEKKLKKRQQLKEQKLAEKSTRDPALDEATVFVGNVPVNTKRVQLIRLFQKYGPVNSIRLRSAAGKILHKHKMRKAAGSLNAYVVLSNKTAAEKALELNGTEFKGVHLRVTKSSLKNPTDMNDENKRTIFVGNLKYSATEEQLRDTFSSCGEVEYVRCIRDGEKGCKGVAYVRFKSTDAVGLALELNQTILDDRPINVERYSAKKLGAKEQRDALAAKDKKNKSNKTTKGDNSKKSKTKINPKMKPATANQKDGEDTKKIKKSEFRGVKVEALKKKLKMKKKKATQSLDIAKKIAPRPKKE